MSTTTAISTLPRLAHTGKVTQARVILSEWTKLRSLRSTRWSLLVAVLFTIGLPCLFGAVTSSHWGSMSPHEQADRHPLDIALAGVNLSQLAIGVLGVLVITGEYSTGMIRASMTAVPKRLPVLWAKVAVYATVSFLLMLPSVLIAFFASQAIISHHQPLQISFSAHGVARSVIGGALYLMVIGDLHARDRRDHPQHRRRHRGVRRDHVRDPAADERAADELEQRDLAVPAEQRRPRGLLTDARLGQPRPVARIRALLRLRDPHDRDRRGAPAPPRHVDACVAGCDGSGSRFSA